VVERVVVLLHGVVGALVVGAVECPASLGAVVGAARMEQVTVEQDAVTWATGGIHV